MDKSVSSSSPLRDDTSNLDGPVEPTTENAIDTIPSDTTTEEIKNPSAEDKGPMVQFLPPNVIEIPVTTTPVTPTPVTPTPVTPTPVTPTPDIPTPATTTPATTLVIPTPATPTPATPTPVKKVPSTKTPVSHTKQKIVKKTSLYSSSSGKLGTTPGSKTSPKIPLTAAAKKCFAMVSL